MRRLSPGAGVALAALVLGVILVLAVQAIVRPAPHTAAPGDPIATIPFPTGEPSFDLGTPLTVITVDAAPLTLDGVGPRQVAYRLTGDAPLLAHLDCRLCSSVLVWRSSEQPGDLYRGDVPYTGDARLNAGALDRQGILRIDTVGRWKLTLTRG